MNIWGARERGGLKTVRNRYCPCQIWIWKHLSFRSMSPVRVRVCWELLTQVKVVMVVMGGSAENLQVVALGHGNNHLRVCPQSRPGHPAFHSRQERELGGLAYGNVRRWWTAEPWPRVLHLCPACGCCICKRYPTEA